MGALKFYKGESMNIIFTAYDNGNPPKLIDISSYTKSVELFTPYSLKLTPTISNINNNSFQINLTADQTKSLEAGNFNIVVRLSKGTEVKIGKSIPCSLLDPYMGCGGKGLYVDEGQVKVDMSIDASAISFDMFFGTANIMIDGADAEGYIAEATKNKADKVNENGELVVYAPEGKVITVSQEKGQDTEKAPSLKLFTDTTDTIGETAQEAFTGVDNLLDRLYAEGDDGSEIVTEYFGDGTSKPQQKTNWARYIDQSLFQDKNIVRIEVNVDSAGVFGIFSGTTTGAVGSWQILAPVVAGKNTITVNRKVPANEYLFFAGAGTTVNYLFKNSSTPQGGGFNYGGNPFYNLELCIGVWTGEAGEIENEGDITELFRRIETLEKGNGPVEATKFFGDGTTTPQNKTNWIRYIDQSLFQDKNIAKIEVNVDSAGVFGIYSGTTTGAVGSWQMLAPVVAGKNTITVNKKIPANEYLFFAGAGSTVNYLYKSSNTPQAGGVSYGGTTFYFELCIGVWTGGEDIVEVPRIQQLKDMEKAICKYYAIPCIDVTDSSQISAFSVPSLMPDGLHPNDAGHKFLATAIYSAFYGFIPILPSGSNYYSIGDSITVPVGAGVSYAKYMANASGYNLISTARSGITIIGDGFINQINQIPENFEGLVSIMIGVNDHNTRQPLGEATTVLAKDYTALDRTASTAEAFRYGLETLLRKAPLCKVFVIVPFFTTVP